MIESAVFNLAPALLAGVTLFALESSAFAQAPQGYAIPAPGADFAVTRSIPAGTEIKVIVQTGISSDSSQVGDPFSVKVAPDDESGVPKSLQFVGHLRKVLPATNNDPGELGVRFDGFAPAFGNWQQVGGAQLPETEQASAHFYGSNKANDGKNDVGIGAVAGALLGGSRKRKLGDTLEGGLLGALGGYAVQKATTHSASDITLKQGQEVTITLKRPIMIRTEVISS